ncbi:phosphatidylinositol 3- and 4-kinase [Ancylostoma ceylanicum]|uniref:Phosphatidylinositol 3-and 4-kinase n=1 Tax=Ancylostoma ceylanicum TaxID=53326 RepID=A0A0D6M0B3_9BILA|nr:phosphatidylinositol 3- and 4-kinase [Ancylostoma ceylanicum]
MIVKIIIAYPFHVLHTVLMYKFNELCMAGDYSGDELVRWDSMERVCIQADGLSAPKVLRTKGSDGKLYKLIWKNEDVRQDCLVEQLFSIVNSILNGDDDDAFLRTYKLVAYLKNVTLTRHFFYRNYTTVRDWTKMINNYRKSLAQWSIGMILEYSKRTLPIPERVPFRLTRDLLDPLLIEGTGGRLEEEAVHAMQLLRDSKHVIIGLASVLLRETISNFEEVDPGGGDRPSFVSETAIARLRDKLNGTDDTFGQQDVHHQAIEAVNDEHANSEVDVAGLTHDEADLEEIVEEQLEEDTAAEENVRNSHSRQSEHASMRDSVKAQRHMMGVGAFRCPPKYACLGCRGLLTEAQRDRHKMLGCDKDKDIKNAEVADLPPKHNGTFCAQCLAFYPTFRMLCLHYEEEHGLDCPVEEVLVKSEAEFDQFYKWIQSEGGIKFIGTKTRTSRDGSRVYRFFQCCMVARGVKTFIVEYCSVHSHGLPLDEPAVFFNAEKFGEIVALIRSGFDKFIDVG